MRRTGFVVASAALATVLAAIGTFQGDDDHAVREFLIVLAIIVIATAVLFWLVVPRVSRFGRGALILAILAVLSIAVFWLGLPPLFAGAATLLALAARPRGAETGMANAALAFAALAVVTHVVLAFAG